MLPVNDVFLNLHSLETMRAKGNKPETVSLAEIGSFTLEWHALSARTGKPAYGVQADSILNGLNQRYPKQVSSLLVKTIDKGTMHMHLCLHKTLTRDSHC